MILSIIILVLSCQTGPSMGMKSASLEELAEVIQSQQEIIKSQQDMIKDQQDMIIEQNKKIDHLVLKTNKIEEELSNVPTKMELSNVSTKMEEDFSNVPTKMELTNVMTKMEKELSTVTTKMEEEFSNIDQKTTQMAKGLAFLRDPPVYFGCGYRDSTIAVNSRVSFNSIYYERKVSYTL